MKIKALQLIHLGYCASILVFAGVVILVNKATMTFDFKLGQHDPSEFIAPITAVAFLFIAPLIFNKIVQSIEDSSDAATKITKYQSAFIVKFALLEGAALFNIVMCLKTSNSFFLLFAALSFLVMLMGRPTLDKICSDFNLQNSDLD